jgi:hypothetical protein
MTIKTRKVWVIVSKTGELASYSTHRTRRVAEIIANGFDYSRLYPPGPHRVVRAELRYPVKGKERKDNA